MPLNQIVVGPQTSGDGGQPTARGGRNAEAIVQELHGRYYEQAFRRNIFTASNAASTSSAGLATTYTGGVCISNPAGSTVNLVVLKVSSAMTVISAAVTTAGVIVGYSSAGVVTHTTVLTPFSNFVGGGTVPVAKADQAATLVGTPVWSVAGFASTGIAVGVFAQTIDLEGSLVIPPGGYVATGTSVASPVSAMLCSISWEETAV